MVFKVVDYDIGFRLYAIKNSLYGIVDLLCLFLGSLSLLAVHRIPCYGRCLCLLFDDLSNKTRKEKYEDIPEYAIWAVLGIINVAIAVTDLCLFGPLLVMAFLTHPLSSIQSFKHFRGKWTDKDGSGTKMIRYNWPLRVQFAYLALF